MKRRRWISLAVLAGATAILITGFYLYRCYAVQEWSNKGGGKADFFLVPSFEGVSHFHSSWVDRTWSLQHCVHVWKQQTAYSISSESPRTFFGVPMRAQIDTCVLDDVTADGYQWLDWL